MNKQLLSGVHSAMKKQSVSEKNLHRKNQMVEAKRQKKTDADVTERKKAEDELKKQKEFDERIINSLSDALLVIDPSNFKILHANKAALKQTKLKSKELVGKTCYETMHHSSKPCCLPSQTCPVQDSLKLGKKVTVEHVHFDKENGKEFVEVTVNPAITPEGKTVIIHVAKDITERKRMLQQLVDSEEMFRTISNVATDAIILVDGQGMISFWNPPAERIFGYSKKEVIGKAVHELFPLSLSSKERNIVDLAFKEFCETGKCDFAGQTVELIAKKKDGSEFPLELSLSSMNLKGKWHALALVRDITEQQLIRKQIEEYSQGLELTVEARTQELTEANQRLLKAERFSAIGELAGMIGHDLRNPLTGIKNAAYYLKRKQGCLDEAKGTEMLKIIDSSVEHANRIINDLLEYSREIHLELEESCPKSLLDYVLLMVKIPSHIKVLDRTLNQPTIWIDTNKVERVFINLIKNSIDAMPDKGTLEIRSRQVGDNVEFVFADTGTGMTEETLSKIFMPLFTTKAQGMGFGLAICKRIVEAHGGRITVESSVGRGTAFTVILPVEQKLKAAREDAWLFSQDTLQSVTETQENK
jgi:PAS domain S-box-containing protein